jgi:hypothetical protein
MIINVTSKAETLGVGEVNVKFPTWHLGTSAKLVLASIITGKQRSRDEPSGSKAVGLYLEAACKPKFWSRYRVNNSRAGPSVINVIEAVRLCAFAPPSSSLDRHGIGFPFTRSLSRIRGGI